VLPALETIDGTLQVHSSPLLASLSFPALTTLQVLAVYNDQSLQSVGFPRLTALTGNFEFYNDATLADLGAAQLTSIGGRLKVVSNASLAALDLPVLQTVGGDFVVRGNAVLPACTAQTIFDRLVDFAGTIVIRDNDSSGCRAEAGLAGPCAWAGGSA